MAGSTKSANAAPALLDRELEDLPQALRWREWMRRIEAVLFSASAPMTRETLAQLVGREAIVDLLIEDIAADISDRPYEIRRTGGGWQMVTRKPYADIIAALHARPETKRALTQGESLILAAVAYMQPITRAAISQMTGREISRETMARLHQAGLIARGPRSPDPGAPYTYVTTQAFLEHYGFESLRDLPDLEALMDAGLLVSPDLPGVDLGVAAMPIAPEKG